jgi:hypothetical protein
VSSLNASHKNIHAHLILSDTAWSESGEMYKKAFESLIKLSLVELRTLSTVLTATPQEVNEKIELQKSSPEDEAKEPIILRYPDGTPKPIVDTLRKAFLKASAAWDRQLLLEPEFPCVKPGR